MISLVLAGPKYLRKQLELLLLQLHVISIAVKIIPRRFELNIVSEETYIHPQIK